MSPFTIHVRTKSAALQISYLDYFLLVNLGKTDMIHCQISRIKPGKGEAVVYPKDAKKLMNHMILQIPTPKTKGIIIYPTGMQF